MKKLLKKIGVLGLIIAIFAPFIELPTVNAAEGCTNHLQNYLWLDMNYFIGGEDKTFMEGYSKDTNPGGYQTYTNFPYSFKQDSNERVNIKSIDMNNLTDSNSYDNFWNAFSIATSSLTSYDIDTTIGGTLVTNAKLSNYKDDTILLHGVWSSFDRSGTPIDSNWREKVTNGETNSLQKILKTSDITSMAIKFKPANYSDGNFGLENGELNADYFQKIVDNGYNVWGDSSKTNYIPLSITRTLNLSADEIKDMLDDYVFGYKDSNSGKWLAVSTTTGTSVRDVKKSYSALIGDSSSRKYIEVSESDIDFDTSKAYYWPAVLSVEYETCPLSQEESWTLEYDGNVNDNSVTNIPNKQTNKLNNDITVDSKKPARDGYTFKEWCENPNGSGTCYNAGDKVKSPDSAKTITLFAQWGKGGTEDNKKTGVMSYVIGFISVGIIAGGIYLVAKKKNLFKQI